VRTPCARGPRAIVRAGSREARPRSGPAGDPCATFYRVNPENPTGADAIAKVLEELGVSVVFGITGAGNLAIYDAIARRGTVRTIFVHHEQAAVMAAQGYSRTTGRLGVVLVTTGGGSTNALTGIVGANMDSVPVLVLTGNESSIHTNPDNVLRIWGTQGFDSKTVFAPVAKGAFRVRNADEIRKVVADAAQLAMSPRAGAVTVDVPMDLQRKPLTTRLDVPADQTARIVAPSFDRDAAKRHAQHIAGLLAEAKRPVLLLGNGLRQGMERRSIRELVSSLGVPTLLSWSGADLLDAAHPLNFGKSGVYGDRYSNMIVQNSDLVVAIGSRLAIPQMSYDPADYARGARIVVVDIDPAELRKFTGDRWVRIEADAATVFSELASTAGTWSDPEDWTARCEELRATFPRRLQTSSAIPLEDRDEYLNSYDVVYEISDQAGPDDIFVTDMGTGLLSGFYGLDVRENQRLSTSLGLGEMGYGLPAAIGAQIAHPERRVICLNADGGMMLNLQELQTMAHHKLPIKLVVFSNDGYLMIKHSQRNLFDGRLVGSDPESGVSVPHFGKLAEAFGFPYLVLDTDADIPTKVAEFLATPGPVILDVAMHPDQLFIPRVGTLRGEGGALISPPLEDVIPLISEDSLRAAMNGALHSESIRIRRSAAPVPIVEAAG
jgi:acetolactate synthase I/II/III large subunit